MPNANSTEQNAYSNMNNIETEQALLGSILLDFSSMNTVAEYVKQDYFYLPQHKTIFSVMMAMFANNANHVDPIVIADALVKEGHYDEVGGKEYLVTLQDSVPSAANAEEYAKIVREQYYLRRLYDVSQDIMNQASEGVDANGLLDYAEKSIYDIRSDNDSGGLKKLSDIISGDVFENLSNLQGADADKYRAISTGFDTLDHYIIGLYRSNLIILGGRPGAGKTALALNIARNICVNSKKKCAYFNLEMRDDEVAERLLAYQAEIPSDKIKSGALEVEDWRRISDALTFYRDADIFIDDTPNITVPEIKARVRRHKDIDVVIVDYLGLIQPTVRADNRVQEVQEITRSLKIMAKDLDVPVICCAQLNRNSVKSKDTTPQLSDLRESGSIEQDADIVLLISENKPESADEEGDEPSNTIRLSVAKNRHGSTGNIDLLYEKEFSRFRAIDKTERYE